MTEHYFTTPDAELKRRQVTIRVWDSKYAMTTANGVFSMDGMDLGTSVLLRENEPLPGAGTVLDLGCGWGAIAVPLAVESPEAEIWAVDINDRALQLCAENAAAQGVADRVHCVRPEDVPADVAFDEIWSNPPIRIGKDALHELLLTWLPRLAADGVARLVVGKNLGADSLQKWLIEQGYECERTASAKGFRVFEVSAPGNIE